MDKFNMTVSKSGEIKITHHNTGNVAVVPTIRDGLKWASARSQGDCKVQVVVYSAAPEWAPRLKLLRDRPVLQDGDRLVYVTVADPAFRSPPPVREPLDDPPWD